MSWYFSMPHAISSYHRHWVPLITFLYSQSAFLLVACASLVFAKYIEMKKAIASLQRLCRLQPPAGAISKTETGDVLVVTAFMVFSSDVTWILLQLANMELYMCN